MASMKMGEDTRSDTQKCYDYTRNIYSTCITLGSIALIFYSIGAGLAALEGPPPVLMIILVLVLILLGYLEGLQVAILALERINSEPWKDAKPRGYTNHKLAVANRGLNVQRFLVGRQFFVVFVVFVIANLTTYKDLKIDWLPRWLFISLIQTGLPGALVVLAFGQLMPQLVASSHPITFMNLRGSWFVIQLCLCFEVIGITHFSWVLTKFVRFVFGLRDGEEISLDDGKPNYETLQHLDGFLAPEKMYMNVAPLELLHSTCAYGMQYLEKDEWLRDSTVQDIFRQWGHNSNNPQGSLPSVQDIATYLVSTGQSVPRYLLPKNHPKHIPPHIIIMELTRRAEEQETLTEDVNHA